MTKRTRYFLIGAALIVLVGLGTGLVAYYKGDLPLFRTRVGPDELAYVPADATGVAYANVRQIMDSEFRQKLREVMPTGQAKDEFHTRTGIDIERDIQSVVAAAPSGGFNGPPLILIRGHFDEGRIEQLIREQGGTIEDYGGRRLLLVPDRRGEAPVLTFPESGLALFGGEAAVKRAIDTRAAGASNITDNAELMRIVAQLEGAGNSAWAVGGLEAVASNPNLPAQVRAQLPSLEWIAVAARVDGGVNAHVLAEAKDEKAANDLRAVVNGAIAAGRLVGGSNPKLDALINSLQVSGTDRQLDVTFNVPPELLDLIPHQGPR